MDYDQPCHIYYPEAHPDLQGFMSLERDEEPASVSPPHSPYEEDFDDLEPVACERVPTQNVSSLYCKCYVSCLQKLQSYSLFWVFVKNNPRWCPTQAQCPSSLHISTVQGHAAGPEHLTLMTSPRLSLKNQSRTTVPRSALPICIPIICKIVIVLLPHGSRPAPTTMSRWILMKIS
jgi:hypothetical protein